LKILLTGASGGIGSAILRELILENHSIDATYYKANIDDLFQHENVNWVKIDFEVTKELSDLFDSSSSYDVVINCAGVANSALVGSNDLFESEKLININLKASMIILNKSMPSMIKRGFGRIIFFGSVVGRDGAIGLSTYSATKSALLGLVSSAVREIPIHKRKINPKANFTINIVSPGFTETEMTKGIPNKVREEIIERSASGRFVRPEEVSRVVMFLIHTESEAINGSEIHVNCGSYL
jgi:NAD(P)-dependent dehydrogenase (short-subunit alcohol dehydrogenase family)